MIKKYCPKKVMTIVGERIVVSVIAHPKNNHPKDCPIVLDRVAIELITSEGSRWYGCERAYINSELRVIVEGFNPNNEEMANWQTVPSDKEI